MTTASSGATMTSGATLLQRRIGGQLTPDAARLGDLDHAVVGRSR